MLIYEHNTKTPWVHAKVTWLRKTAIVTKRTYIKGLTTMKGWPRFMQSQYTL